MAGRMWVRAAVLGALLVTPRMALAGEWPRPLDGRVGLAYAEQWTDASGRSCTHGGLDLEAPAGTRVSSCAGGRVAFAGRIPASGGGTTFAVSVVTPDGLRVTYLPLAACSVDAGAEVLAGERIGELAGSGDGSLVIPHLHLSVRRGETQIDPATLLDGPTSAGSGDPPPAAAPSVRAPVGGTVLVSGPVAAPAPAGAAAPAAAASPMADAPGPVRFRAPEALGPRTESRIRPLPYDLRFDVRAALDQARATASAGRGLAVRALLALLAALLFARIARAASRGAAGMSELSPALAHARRVRR